MQTSLKRLGFQFSTRYDMSAKFPRGGGGSKPILSHPSITGGQVFAVLVVDAECILLPRPLSNDPRFIQCIYRYSHVSKRFVEV